MWEKLTKIRSPRGGQPMIATLAGHTRRPVLRIGSKLLDAGFDPTLTYELMFDRASKLIGLRRSTTANAYRITKQGNAGSVTYLLQATKFCERFEIDRRLVAVKCWQEGDDWVLQMQEQTDV